MSGSPAGVLQRLLETEKRIPDPGDAGTIAPDRDFGVCALTSAGAETRTVSNPADIGIRMTICGEVVAGTITLTFSSAFDEAGTTTFAITATGQAIHLESVAQGARTYVWRAVGGDTVQAEVELSEVVTATNVIDASESGKTFYLNAAGGFTSTLPAPALGLKFRFIVKTAPTTAYIIVTTSGANLMYGKMLERAGAAGVAGAARDTFNFVASQAIISDWVEFESDGTNWYYFGMVDVAAGNTVSVT